MTGAESMVVPPGPEESTPAMDIYRQYRGLIAAGALGSGERLPTVRQTAADLGVAVGTAARAYRLLEQDGLVVTRRAAGTRVAASAGVLPAGVLRQVRTLVVEADAQQAAIDDVIDVLRVVWASKDDISR